MFWGKATRLKKLQEALELKNNDYEILATTYARTREVIDKLTGERDFAQKKLAEGGRNFDALSVERDQFAKRVEELGEINKNLERMVGQPRDNPGADTKNPDSSPREVLEDHLPDSKL